MKSARDPRHLKRQKIISGLFAHAFRPDTIKSPAITKIIENLKKIDNYIKEAAPQFPLNKINKIDLAILRLAVFEIFIESKTPVKVIIDEAVELAKEFGSENSPKFVNGVLGTLSQKH